MVLFRSLGWALLYSLLVFVAHWLPLLPGPGWAAGPVNALAVLVSAPDLLALLLWPAALLGVGFALRLGLTSAPSRWRGRWCTALLVLSSWPLLAWANQQVVARWLRPWAIRTVVARGHLLVQALVRYQQHQRRYPVHLADLVSDQLPALPTPGLLGTPAFAYRTRPDNGRDELLGVAFPERPLLPWEKSRLFYSPVPLLEQAGTSSGDALHAVGRGPWYLTTYAPRPGLFVAPDTLLQPGDAPGQGRLR